MGEILALRERTGELHNDLEAIDRVLLAMGYEGELQGRQVRQSLYGIWQSFWHTHFFTLGALPT